MTPLRYPVEITEVPALARLHAEVLRAFEFFNKRYWLDDPLPLPEIAWFPQPPNGHKLGHFSAGRWMDGKQRRHEIIFYADLCFRGGMDEVLLTLVHEMVHLWQQERGSPSTADNPAYHNTEWNAEAARVGLHVIGHKGYTSATVQFRNDMVDFAPRVRDIPFRTWTSGARGTGKMRKWSCKCGVNVRVGRAEFVATCGLCGKPFKLRD